MLRKQVSRKAKLATEAPVNGGRNYDGPVTSQREIEMAVRAALAKGAFAENTVLKPKVTLSIPEIGLEHVIDGEIGLS